jgi:hypothetical protein
VATRAERLAIGRRRIVNILRTYTVAGLRTLEQKISDAGPPDQRIDPHILTEAKRQLGERITNTDVWLHLTETPADEVARRIAELAPLHQAISRRPFLDRVGQALEIAVYRALNAQQELQYFGAFLDLNEHDDRTRYSREEPPSAMSGRVIPGKRKFDFLVGNEAAGWAGVELKNVREWFYPSRLEIRDLLFKSYHLNVVPVLIARRIHYSTKLVFEPCGVIFWETLRQRYPTSEAELAAKVSDKTLLGYHDIILGNEPDPQLTRFIHDVLPNGLEAARERFNHYRDLLGSYGEGRTTYRELTMELGHGGQEWF